MEGARGRGIGAGNVNVRLGSRRLFNIRPCSGTSTRLLLANQASQHVSMAFAGCRMRQSNAYLGLGYSLSRDLLRGVGGWNDDVHAAAI